MYLEGKSRFVQRAIAHPVFSHLWVMGLLIVPLPLLFHRTFVDEVLVPLRDVLLQIGGL
jgi:alginate O-acetyltransferase complex protein AlgI